MGVTHFELSVLVGPQSFSEQNILGSDLTFRASNLAIQIAT